MARGWGTSLLVLSAIAVLAAVTLEGSVDALVVAAELIRLALQLSTAQLIAPVCAVLVTVTLPRVVDALEVGALELCVAAHLAGCRGTRWALVLVAAILAVHVAVTPPPAWDAALSAVAAELVGRARQSLFTSFLIAAIVAVLVLIAAPPLSDAGFGLGTHEASRGTGSGGTGFLVLASCAVLLPVTLPVHGDALSTNTALELVLFARVVGTDGFILITVVSAVIFPVTQPSLQDAVPVPALELRIRTCYRSTICLI